MLEETVFKAPSAINKNSIRNVMEQEEEFAQVQSGFLIKHWHLLLTKPGEIFSLSVTQVFEPKSKPGHNLLLLKSSQSCFNYKNKDPQTSLILGTGRPLYFLHFSGEKTNSVLHLLPALDSF